jgi:predicted Fe-Mo cluster-binding NifX family protein
MRLGIPTWAAHVSPVLDVAKHLLMVDAEDGAEVGRREADIEETNLAARARRISELGVELLICGAVSRPLEEALVSMGVRVFPQVCGPVENVLRAFLSGRLEGEAFRMPGCRGRRLRRRGQSCGGRAVSGTGCRNRERGGDSRRKERGREV